MSFLTLNLKREYRSFKDNIVREFYLPVLKNSVIYKRAVGFFSSSALAEVSLGISGLIENGGKIQLIASPKLSEEDINAINLGYKIRNEVIEQNLLSQLNSPRDYFESERLNMLAHLIIEGKLDIKIAILNSNNQLGIYHEKLGIVKDNNENTIVFSGSLNETANAMLVNYESIDVFTSWNDIERVEDKEKAFSEIWNNNAEGLEVLDFPKVKKAILERYKRDKIDLICESDECDFAIDQQQKKMPKIPVNIKLYDYQLQAINNWKENNYRGIFDMATGTGKTYTGIAAVINLYNYLNGRLAIVIVCPYTHLVEQWVEDLNMFNIKPIIAYSESTDKNYKNEIKDSVIDYNLGVIEYFCLITTNATFRSEFVQNRLEKIKGNAVLVVDEAHNFGASSLQRCLLENFNHRLALSATLERHNDDNGTYALYKYFGGKCIEYSLERAIREEKLTPYYYFPVKVYLDEYELEKYKCISKEIGKNIINLKNGKKQLNEKAKMLLIKRARIVAGAKNKVSALESVMEKYKDDNYILVYCGATNITENNDRLFDEDDIEEIRQIDCITRLLGSKLNMKVSQFTSKENNIERLIIKDKFANGDDLQALVAIKCLDEGVNIPKIKTAFILASTTNPKEYIQRRGRVLRKSKDKKYAEIYDFITLPRNLSSVKGYSEQEIISDKSLVINEVKRMIEFSSLSLNPYESDMILEQIRDAYDIDIYSLEKENFEGVYDEEK
ncbi:DEAD/DEAH box helicase family protein [Clostridium sp.]|uniref:DEAD/DEAH box helicase family protein n=1 Tax=Clostridium sp. TaxID=1506 RepID=UPI002906AE7F|nr:DEAD/DEAH box helicase family protein [Clostridium sp.]MDU4588809.1 DEAD/DEAH box helicase family protein [Clostridium sp.]